MASSLHCTRMPGSVQQPHAPGPALPLSHLPQPTPLAGDPQNHSLTIILLPGPGRPPIWCCPLLHTPQTDAPSRLPALFLSGDSILLFYLFIHFILCVPNRDERSQEHRLSHSLLCPQDLERGLAHRMCFIGSERDRDRERGKVSETETERKLHNELRGPSPAPPSP